MEILILLMATATVGAIFAGSDDGFDNDLPSDDAYQGPNGPANSDDIVTIASLSDVFDGLDRQSNTD